MSHEEAKRGFSDRKRNILYLIHQYLCNMGYDSAAETIRLDAHLQPEYEICDNMDLDTMYMEYCSYYHMKFQKLPKIIKKIETMFYQPSNLANGRKVKSARASVPSAKLAIRKESSVQKVDETETPSPTLQLTDSLKIKPISQGSNFTENAGDGLRVFRPLSDYENFSPEWKEMAELICKDIIKADLEIGWKDICGNSNAISIIKEAVLLPLQQPSFFSNMLKPWKSVLLHGPPGTGKTLIAKAVCSETLGRVTFFRISPSTIISKWRGESEKTIRVLFEVARFYAPSIIFFDEIEALTSRRDCASEHEASKRFKNEFLSLLDGVGENNENVFILATTNLPWEIDLAFLRRFEKKILIELPKIEERKTMIRHFIPNSVKFADDSFEKLAQSCARFTGDDIRIACKEVAMKQIRDINSSKRATISEADVQAAFEQINPICSKTYQRYIDWSNSHGNKM